MKKMFAALVVVAVCQTATADFKVVESLDKVSLEDGSVIEGTLIARGKKGVLIIVEGEEKNIPDDQVMKVDKGEPTPVTKAYTTDPVEGVKQVTGEGFRENGEAPVPQDLEEDGVPVVTRPGKQPETSAPKVVPGKITPEMVMDAMARDPSIQTYVRFAGGPEKVADMLNDPKQRSQIEQMAKSMGYKLPW